MKPSLLLSTIMLCLCASAQAQTALSTKSAVVSAQVLDTCKFSSASTPITLNLGPLDPSVGDTKTQTGLVEFSCTNGYTIQVGILSANTPFSADTRQSRRLAHRTDPSKTLAYTLDAALPNGITGKGFGPGNQLTLRLDTQIDGAAYLDASSGDYEETLVVELRP